MQFSFRLSRAFLPLAVLSLGLFSCGVDLDEEVAAAYESLPPTLDYNIHVRPILSDRCWSCHGPDEKARKAGLRLDQAEDAYASTEFHGKAIVPGRPGSSELVRRILSQDAEVKMPTPESNLSLTAVEKATLVKWIEQGAQYDPHWAFTPLQPVAEARELAGTTIDSFIQLTQTELGLKPNAAAEPRELIRRVYRDLTGLPPTFEQTQAFVSKPTPEHYGKIVDSLLKSDACAERLTQEWLDVARYADSHGLHADGIRTMWPWRDWVLNAFRQNKSYKDFVTEQVAGDLMPKATQDQILATAFNRNHPQTAEGGAIDEEFRMQYVMDRTNTFATAFLGMTMECAACHDHKFDPVSQKEYYQLTAFFNNVREIGMTGDDGDFGPLMALTDEKTRAQIDLLSKRIQQVEQSDAATAEQISFIQGMATMRKPIAYIPFDKVNGVFADGYPKSSIQDTLFTVPGRKGNAYYKDTEYDVVDVPVSAPDAYQPFSISIYVKTEKKTPGQWQTFACNSGNKNSFWRGIDFSMDPENRVNLKLTHSLPGNCIEVASIASVPLNEWTHVAFTYDGSSRADGIKLYINGKPTAQKVIFDKLYKSIFPLTNDSKHNPENRAMRIGLAGRAFTGENGIFKGALDELYIFDDQLSEQEMGHVAQIEGSYTPSASAQADHQRILQWRQKANKLYTLRKEKLEKSNTSIDVMVMADMPESRKTFLLDRGSYSMPKDEVQHGTPVAVLNFEGDKFAANRLGLTEWLFAEQNPLSARVAANRYWQMIMGKGIVATPHDFGMQGKLPSHPALLDYLANGLRKSNWDLKAYLRAIVTSETYKLSSEKNPENLAIDPDNVYYTRASSTRYPGEFIRDYALKVSGLLVPKLGGPSVFPYQPAGLWEEKSSFSPALYSYKIQHGDSLYRRGMYTFIRRTSPPPAMTALDQPSRDRCTVSREQTNTPLQALILLNDPQFVEAARVLAQAVDAQGQLSTELAIAGLFKRVLGRDPSPKEAQTMLGVYQKAKAGFGESPKMADELLAVGEFAKPAGFKRDHLAALTVVANTVLNHDEIYTRR